jgi:VanZ family protein
MARTAAPGAPGGASSLLGRLRAWPRGRRWWLVAAWMALIFAMSADPGSGEQSDALVRLIASTLGLAPTPEEAMHWHHLLRKGAHFTEYAILAALTGWALPAGRPRWWLAWAIATAYAATDELHQAFVPNRGPAAFDVGIDSTGAATASLLLAVATRRWGRREAAGPRG